MTDKAAETESTEKPILRLQKMYVKDLSFENPNAPEVFRNTQKAEPNVELNLKLNNRKIGDEHWEVSMEITAKVTTKGDEEKVLFMLEVEHAGIFLMKAIPEKHLAMVLGVECPTMLFPFTRQVVSQAAVDGGFMPFLMEPINFLALFQNSQKENSTSN
ncbi:protein-export chaperone SecB [Desulfofustis glycolicus]|uniref:Protein translocase subunit secB n=1 Tax=Desulfofustis glycolicus DSM 9705 TaxID=1121409 RepID=A0A1M5SEM5_9BACT|nr:protein-export chaperone SecB [Desulfofustis glycolicus]MCB2216123.1 protein-export chaperone SecB [Desulfobulbaceae bacterium]SHH36976.1 protein translocase subunit secB [Desulfofustis glycolicus DSM 9705]